MSGRGSIFGTDASDFLRGSNGTDIISAKDGDDLVFGLGGDDMIRGNAGNDVIKGGDGNDTITGGTGNDIILGEEGDDAILLDSGFDTAYGGAGDDIFSSRDGGDILAGGAGENTFIIENTTLNGDTLINDYWADEKNKIIARDSKCEMDAKFDFAELSQCLENEPPSSEPVLHVKVEECVASIYFTPHDEQQPKVCKQKDMMCLPLQEQLELQTAEALADTQASEGRIETYSGDLYEFYKVGSAVFPEETE